MIMWSGNFMKKLGNSLSFFKTHHNFPVDNSGTIDSGEQISQFLSLIYFNCNFECYLKMLLQKNSFVNWIII